MLTKSNGHCRSDVDRQQLHNQIISSQPALRAYAMKLARNEDRADDLVQETLRRTIQHLDQFEPGTNLVAWMTTILHNTFRSEWRKRKREQAWDPRYENDLQWSTGHSEMRAESAHDLNLMLMYIACLPIDQADALIAVGCLRMEYEEAAERLGCPVGTIKSRVNRARDLLFEYLEDNARLAKVDLTPLKSATRGVPPDHPYYPIAQAYEELYTDLQSVNSMSISDTSKEERLWQHLVASGAADTDMPELDDLLRGGDE